MANNTILNVGTLGDVIRDIDRAGVKTQVAQLDIGGTAAELLVIAGQQTMANSLPVVIASNQPAITAQIANNAVLSGSNSSVAVLAANAAFTGPADDITEYADVRVTVFSDVASAADGLQLQQSTNGTNWDSIDAYSIPANSGKTFSVGVSARFFRVVYTNGATVQAAFRLQTKYNKTYSKASSVRPQDGRTNDNDAASNEQ